VTCEGNRTSQFGHAACYNGFKRSNGGSNGGSQHARIQQQGRGPGKPFIATAAEAIPRQYPEGYSQG
jgi:hypothetical protein